MARSHLFWKNTLQNSPKTQRHSQHANVDNDDEKPFDRGFHSYTAKPHDPKSCLNPGRKLRTPAGYTLFKWAVMGASFSYLTLTQLCLPKQHNCWSLRDQPYPNLKKAISKEVDDYLLSTVSTPSADDPLPLNIPLASQCHGPTNNHHHNLTDCATNSMQQQQKIQKNLPHNNTESSANPITTAPADIAFAAVATADNANHPLQAKPIQPTPADNDTPKDYNCIIREICSHLFRQV